MLDQVAKILIDEKKRESCSGTGKQISEDYEGKDLVVICILKGAIILQQIW